MTADESKRTWFEEVPIQPKSSHARTKPLIVQKVKKRAQARPDSSAMERGKKSNIRDSTD